jgi:hypothetical protein
VGVQDDHVFLGHYGSRDKAFALAGRLHARRIRVMVQWSKTLGAQANLRRAPRIPRWDFGELDRLLDAADANGMRLQLVLTGPVPAFATANRRVGVYKPSARQFARFVAATARHFQGRVDRYSIWNEPNYKGWLAPVASAPRLYRALYVTGYRTIKRIDPGAQVLIGETVPYDERHGRLAMAPLRFLRQMLCVDARYRHSRCGHVNADGYAHHPYDFAHAPGYRYPGADNATIGTLGRLTAALDKLRTIGALRGPRGAKLPIYLTEYGYFASGPRRISEAKRGRYLVQAFRIAMANPRVREMLQYLLIAPPKGAPGEYFATWLANRNGVALPAFRVLARFLGGATAPTSRAASLHPAPVASALRTR